MDLGTTAVKGCLYAPDGREIAAASREYELETPVPGLVEAPHEVYWSAFTEVVRGAVGSSGVDPTSVVALALSCQGETLLLVGSDGVPLRPAIVWLDNRAGREAEELSDRFGRERIYEVTGQPEMLATWPAAKALWLARHEPDTFEKTDKLLLLEDYFLLRLTGDAACEGSLVTSTCYWDFRRKAWWPEMLDAVHLRPEQLPPLVESGERVGTLRASVAEELGLAPGTIVCAGALDQACGAIGVGNVTPGILSENTGTAVALCATLDGPRTDPEMRMPCHYHGLPDTYMFHSFTSGGVVLRWFRDEFGDLETLAAGRLGCDAYDLLVREAERVPAGAQGLVVLPHFQGAMAPESNSDATGVVVGLTLAHGRAHLVRALLESVAFVIRRNVEVLGDLGVAVAEVRALGGGARSRLWKQIEADVLKMPVRVSRYVEPATLGAAILAGVGAGLYSSAREAAAEMCALGDAIVPDPRHYGAYDDAYEKYRAIYEALCPVFARGTAA